VPDFTQLTGTVQGGILVPGSALAARSRSPAAVNNGYVYWSGSLPPGESHTFVFTVIVDAVAPPQGYLSSSATGMLSSHLVFELPLRIGLLSLHQVAIPMVVLNN
jgi:hypothetical protein